jgi:hypothetical protein
VGSLQLDQQKQEQALALLRQRAEQEVWETQLALDRLLFKPKLEVSGQLLHSHVPCPTKPDDLLKWMPLPNAEGLAGLGRETAQTPSV